MSKEYLIPMEQIFEQSRWHFRRLRLPGGIKPVCGWPRTNHGWRATLGQVVKTRLSPQSSHVEMAFVGTQGSPRSPWLKDLGATYFTDLFSCKGFHFQYLLQATSPIWWPRESQALNPSRRHTALWRGDYHVWKGKKLWYLVYLVTVWNTRT